MTKTTLFFGTVLLADKNQIRRCLALIGLALALTGWSAESAAWHKGVYHSEPEPWEGQSEPGSAQQDETDKGDTDQSDAAVVKNPKIDLPSWSEGSYGHYKSRDHYRAFVVTSTWRRFGVVSWSEGEPTVEIAISKALDECQKTAMNMYGVTSFDCKLHSIGDKFVYRMDDEEREKAKNLYQSETGGIQLNPKLAGAFNNRGVEYKNKGEYDRAIAAYDEAIRLNPNFAVAFANRGAAYDDKGEYDRAIADYDQAIRLKPDLTYAFFNRGNAYGHKGDYDSAFRDYDQAIRLDPEFAVAYGGRGRAYEKLGNLDAAIRDYRKQYDLGGRSKWLVKKLKKHGVLP